MSKQDAMWAWGSHKRWVGEPGTACSYTRYLGTSGHIIFEINNSEIQPYGCNWTVKGERTCKTGLFRHQKVCVWAMTGVLVRKMAIIVPRVLQARVTQLAHKLSHPGVERTYEDMKGRFFWIGMRKADEQCCKTCAICLENRGPQRNENPSTQYDSMSPHQSIATDVATFLCSEDRYRYILVMVYLLPNIFRIGHDAWSISRVNKRGTKWYPECPEGPREERWWNISTRSMWTIRDRKKANLGLSPLGKRAAF